jgi:hypothetical protein
MPSLSLPWPIKGPLDTPFHHTSSQAFSSFFSFHRDQINSIFLCLPVLSSSKSRRSIPAKADGRSQQEPTVDPSKNRRQEPTVDPNNAEPSPSDPLTRELKAAIDGVFYSSGCLSGDPALLALRPPPPCKTNGHRLVPSRNRCQPGRFLS